MKILIVRTFAGILDTKSYNSQEIGLARAFVRAGHECDIVYYNGRNPSTSQQIPVPGCEQTITLYRLQGYNLLKNGIFKGLRALIKEYDVLQVAEYDQLTSWWLYRFYHKKIVTLYHGPYQSEFTRGYNLKCKVFDLFFNRKAKNKAVPCFAKSRLAADFLRTKGFAQVQEVGVGLDMDTLNAQYQEPAQSASAGQLLYIGVLEERRSIRFLMEVLARVKQQCPDVRLRLVGKGEPAYRDACFAYAKELGVWENIDYTERVEQAEVCKLYGAADVLVLPTQYEIFGMVLLEAMYFGLPVLTSRNGGSDLLVKTGENGFICEEFDPEQYAQRAIEIIQNNALRAQMGQAAHQTVQQEFSWDSIAQRMLAVYTAEQQRRG